MVPDGFPTQRPLNVRSTAATYYTQISENDVIEEILYQDIVATDFVNGSDFATPLLTSDATAFQCAFLFEFSDPYYLDGQSYNFSIKFDREVDIAFFAPIDNYKHLEILFPACELIKDELVVGTTFSPDKFYDIPRSYNPEVLTNPEVITSNFIESTDYLSIDLDFSNYYSFEYVIEDENGNIIPDYNEGIYPGIGLIFYVIFKDDNSDRILNFDDITLSPIGHTKDIYGDEYFQDGILGGFEGIEDEMSQVNDKLDDVIGSDEEGSESGIKGILQKIKDLPNTLIEGIKNLFIPSDEDIEDFKDKFDALLTDKLGVLWQAPNLIVDFIQILAAFEPLRSDDFNDYYIEFPSKEIYINSESDDTLDILSESDNGGTLIPLIPSNTENNTYRISFGWLGDSPFSIIYGIYEAAIIFISIIGFCYYCIRKYQSIMGE